MENKYKIEKKLKWVCPEENDAQILAGPNLVKPLHGMNPRTIMGDNAWGKLRKRTYYLANYKCQICGEDCSSPGAMDAHELYSINYVTGEARFAKVIGICKNCHNFYHSGRMFTLCKNKNPLYQPEKVLSIVEHGFRLIYEWNKKHHRKDKIKAYAIFLEYLKQPELAETMEKLIDKYEMEFWGEDTKHICDWEDWKLIFGKREYPTPYKDYQAWEEAMEIASKNDVVRKAENPFVGGAFDEISNILKSTV